MSDLVFRNFFDAVALLKISKNTQALKLLLWTMKTIKKIMGQQVNLYITQSDIDKITNYLKAQKFVFIKDEITPEPKPILVDYLFQENQWARYISLTVNNLDYMNWEDENGEMVFRVRGISAPVMSFSIMGMVEGLFRFRFYYDSFYFEHDTKIEKSPAFEKAVNQFFAWLKNEFEPMPQMPDFYQNADFPMTEIF